MKLPNKLLNEKVIDMAGLCVYCNSIMVAAIITEKVKKSKTQATHGSVTYDNKTFYWCLRPYLNEPSIYQPVTSQPSLL